MKIFKISKFISKNCYNLMKIIDLKIYLIFNENIFAHKRFHKTKNIF